MYRCDVEPGMRESTVVFGVFALATCLLLAQDGAPLAFDVASVKPNQSADSGTHLGHVGGTLTVTNATLKYCILRAYEVADAQVVGPAWLDTERYDIIAKAAADATHDQHRLRLQTLLAERFKLALHRETREGSVYALVAGKGGPKIKKDANAGAGEGDMASSRGHLTATGATMNHLAAFLSGPRAALGRVVINQTGLDGGYSFELDWSTEGTGSDRPSLPTAIQEQLGLKLEARKAPVEMLVIDHVEKAPTEN
jgi:uncharacterized protein (TIGR03435 family)